MSVQAVRELHELRMQCVNYPCCWDLLIEIQEQVDDPNYLFTTEVVEQWIERCKVTLAYARLIEEATIMTEKLEHY